MKSPKNLLVILLALLISFLVNDFSFAETAPPLKDTTVKKQVVDMSKEQTVEAKGGICDCLKGAIDSIQKAYVSLEEDEWPAAIKTTKDAIGITSMLAKTCTCPETMAYQKIAEAYLKYAEGGNHLDGADEPDCPYATKLYSDAIILLDTYISQITNPAVQENAKDVEGYVKEEKEFVDEECGGAKLQEKSKGAEGTQEKKQ